MDWLSKMNAALGYIEDHLTQEIDYECVARKACTSTYNFQRIFSFIADVPLAEYIRRRRLTLAALDLAKGEDTVLTVALRYGYDSPVSFARAFYNLHGINPKEARHEGATLKNYPRISFQITIKGVVEMEYRMETMDAFTLAGVKKTVPLKDGQNFILIPKFWNEVMENGMSDTLSSLSAADDDAVYGVCYGFQKDEFDYMIAVSADKELPEGVMELTVPKSLWVKFACRGPLPKSQQDVWKRLYSEWLPSSGYEETGGPEIEWYSKGDSSSKDYYSEVWIPVRKCE